MISSPSGGSDLADPSAFAPTTGSFNEQVIAQAVPRLGGGGRKPVEPPFSAAEEQGFFGDSSEACPGFACRNASLVTGAAGMPLPSPCHHGQEGADPFMPVWHEMPGKSCRRRARSAGTSARISRFRHRKVFCDGGLHRLASPMRRIYPWGNADGSVAGVLFGMRLKPSAGHRLRPASPMLPMMRDYPVAGARQCGGHESGKDGRKRCRARFMDAS